VTHFDDLSTYTYSDDDVIEREWGWLRFPPAYERLNIGWLDRPHTFEQGPTPTWLADALEAIAADPRINVMRGFHVCSFCPEPTAAMDHYEIRVPGRPGVMFAAPALVGHYVAAHSYRPPREFIEGVREYDGGWVKEPSPWIPEHAERMTFE
jgi:hypothetical protein